MSSPFPAWRPIDLAAFDAPTSRGGATRSRATRGSRGATRGASRGGSRGASRSMRAHAASAAPPRQTRLAAPLGQILLAPRGPPRAQNDWRAQDDWLPGEREEWEQAEDDAYWGFGEPDSDDDSHWKGVPW